MKKYPLVGSVDHLYEASNNKKRKNADEENAKEKGNRKDEKTPPPKGKGEGFDSYA